MTRFEDFDCCLQFTWFNRATHPKHQSSNAVTPQSCLSPFPTLGELVACPPLPTGRGGSRVQAGGGLRSEGVARLACLHPAPRMRAAPANCGQQPLCPTRLLGLFAFSSISLSFSSPLSFFPLPFSRQKSWEGGKMAGVNSPGEEMRGPRIFRLPGSPL